MSDLGQKEDGGKRGNDAQDNSDDETGKEEPIGFFMAPFPHSLGDQSGTASAHHEPDGPDGHNKGINKIDRGKGRLACEVRYEESIDDRINRN